MKRWITFHLIVLSFLTHLCCTQRPQSEKTRLCVATSIFPIFDLIRVIVQDSLDVFYVIPVGANPHTYEPAPTIVRQMNIVDLFIGVYDEFDHKIENYLPEEATRKYLNVIKKAELESHAELEDNPHIWLSVSRAKDIVSEITKHLTKIAPQYQSYFEKNRDVYLARLDSLNQSIASLFEFIQNRTFIQWHPAWDYFASDYHLKILGTIEHGHGDEPSVQRFKALVEQARKQHVQTVVIGIDHQSKAIEALVQEINGKLIRLDTIGNPADTLCSSYIKLMAYNAEKLADALRY